MPKLVRRTKNLILRPLTSKDYEAWRSHLADAMPSRNKWDHGQRKASVATKAAFKKSLKWRKEKRDADNYYSVAVFEKSSGLMIGQVDIMDVVRHPVFTAMVGYHINNNHWGKGYGKEALRAGIDIAFRDLKLHRIEALIEPSNRRSILLARSVGLRKEGLKKRIVLARKSWQDSVSYAATCEEFGIKWREK